jgi:hypothetical protein
MKVAPMGIFAKLFAAEPDRSVFVHPVPNGMQMRIDFKTMECDVGRTRTID